MTMVSQGYQHLCEKVAANDVAGDVMAKLTQLVSDLGTRNFASATAIQTVMSLDH
jgi:hypothetical protein